MSYNSSGGSPDGALAPGKLLRAFVDHYYPVSTTTAPRPPADFHQRVGQFVGSYRPSRSAETNWTKVLSLFQPVTVSAAGDGRLSGTGLISVTGLGPEPKEWVEVEPSVFRQVDGQEILVFRTDRQSRVTHLLVGNFPI